MRISDWSSDVCSSDLGIARSLQAVHQVSRRITVIGAVPFRPKRHLAWAFCFVRNFKPLAGGAPASITGCTMFRGIMVAGLMLVATGAMAADRQAASGAGPSEFEARMISIREAMDDGTYGEVSPAARREVLAALARIRPALGPSVDASRLTERRTIRVSTAPDMIKPHP